MTEQELQAEKDKTAGARITFEFLKHLLRYNIVFSQCQENSDALSVYLGEKNLSWSLPNLVNGYNELTARGHKFVLETLAPPEPVKKELPPLPEVPGMNPKIFTVSDINNMDRERYKKLYFGPHKDQFRARVAEIIRRAKAENEAE